MIKKVSRGNQEHNITKTAKPLIVKCIITMSLLYKNSLVNKMRNVLIFLMFM
jgi:hypothetical protein